VAQRRTRVCEQVCVCATYNAVTWDIGKGEIDWFPNPTDGRNVVNVVNVLASIVIAAGLTAAGVVVARSPERYVRFLLTLRYSGRPSQRALNRYRNPSTVNGMAFGAAGVLLFLGCVAWVGVVVQLVRS
jgi:hypothetical protein